MVRVDGKGNGTGLVRVRNLDKKYQRGSEEIHVLQGLNLDVEKGEFVAFMGPSGSGKTTLLNLLGGLDVPTAGTHHASPATRSPPCRRGKLTDVAGAARRLHLPDVQPDPGADRLPERRAAAAADEALEGGAAQARRDRAGAGRPRRPHAALPAPALRRPGAAGGHRARHRHRPDLPALRRADRRPRPQERRRDHGAARPARPRARQDDPHGHPRPAGRRAGARPCSTSTRACSSRPAGSGGDEVPAASSLANLKRKKIRTTLTVGSFAVALFLFGLLVAIRGAFNRGIDVAGADRLRRHQQGLAHPAAAASPTATRLLQVPASRR